MPTDVQHAKRFRLGSITVTLTPNGDRAGRAFHTMTITRRVRDRSGSWTDAGQIRTCDLPTVFQLTEEASEWLRSATGSQVSKHQPVTSPQSTEPEAELAELFAAIDRQFAR